MGEGLTMDAPLERIVIVDEVRPSSFDGYSIPVTKAEFDFFQQYIPFSLTHEYKYTFTHNVNLAMLLFHRAIKLESSFVSRTYKASYLVAELEKTAPLLRPFALKARYYDNDNLTTMFGLKYVLSDAMERLAVHFPFSSIERLPDYNERLPELKDFSTINESLSAFDNSVFASQPVFIFGSATTIAHNALKKSFSDIDTHLVTPIDSFQTYINTLAFVTAQQLDLLPLSVNIIPEEYASAYFLADPNYMSSPDNSLLRGNAIHYPVLSPAMVEQKSLAALAQNLLRTKKALLDDGFRFWDVSLPAFNAKGKKSNLVLSYARSLQKKLSPYFKQFESYDHLPPYDEARNILVHRSVHASKIFKRFLSYQK